MHRLLKFTEKLKTSDKTSYMFNLIKLDARSVTGRNLRNIMLLVNKSNIDNLSPLDVESIKYCEIDSKDCSY